VKSDFTHGDASRSSIPTFQATQRVNDIKKDIRDITTLKQHAAAITKNQSEIGRLNTEIANLEEELRSTGSSKTADDVQTDLDALSNEM